MSRTAEELNRCTLCPRFSATPTCAACAVKVDRARSLLLKPIITALARKFAERDRATVSPPNTFPDSDTLRQISRSDVKPPLEPAKEGDTAVSGREGVKAEELLRSAKDQAVQVMGEITRAAVKRLVADPRWLKGARSLYSQDEKRQLTELFTAVSGTANLLGRARIRGRLSKKLNEESEVWQQFAEEPKLRPMAPTKALEYFRGLQPGLAVDDKDFSQQQQKRGFTLAVTTEQAVLGKVKEIIAEGLESGESTKSLQARVGKVLEQAGISPRNPQYAEQIVRTNIMNALAVGQQEELEELKDVFTHWRYDGIEDGRERERHRVHFGKIFPSTVQFTRIRDSRAGRFDGYNCRCTFTPLTEDQAFEDRAAWAPGYDFRPTPPASPLPPARTAVPPQERKVQSVTRQQIDREIEEKGAIEVWRGVPSKDAGNKTRAGDPRMAPGDYGTAAYYTADRGTAESYAFDNQDGDLVRAAVKPDARIIEVSELYKLWEAEVEAGRMTFKDDLGEVARRLGFDVIHERVREYYAVVNPDVLVVQKSRPKPLV